MAVARAKGTDSRGTLVASDSVPIGAAPVRCESQLVRVKEIRHVLVKPLQLVQMAGFQEAGLVRGQDVDGLFVT